MAVRTLGCGGSDSRWTGMAPEVTKNKILILAKGVFAHDTGHSQPHAWGIYPQILLPLRLLTVPPTYQGLAPASGNWPLLALCLGHSTPRPCTSSITSSGDPLTIPPPPSSPLSTPPCIFFRVVGSICNQLSCTFVYLLIVSN